MYPWTRPLVPARYQLAALAALLAAVFLPIALAVWADVRESCGQSIYENKPLCRSAD